MISTDFFPIHGAAQMQRVNVTIGKELVAWLMYVSLSHFFFVLILIMHVLLHDTQENYYFIRKEIDKRTKIKSKSLNM